jgi:hypothetical protein
LPLSSLGRASAGVGGKNTQSFGPGWVSVTSTLKCGGRHFGDMATTTARLLSFERVRRNTTAVAGGLVAAVAGGLVAAVAASLVVPHRIHGGRHRHGQANDDCHGSGDAEGHAGPSLGQVGRSDGHNPRPRHHEVRAVQHRVVGVVESDDVAACRERGRAISRAPSSLVAPADEVLGPTPGAWLCAGGFTCGDGVIGANEECDDG